MKKTTTKADYRNIFVVWLTGEWYVPGFISAEENNVHGVEKW